MIVNAVIFGLVIVLLWFGLKILWAQGKAMRIVVVCLSAPILIFAVLVIFNMIGGG